MAKLTCSVDGCERAVQARGWCGTHYSRWREHGDPLAVCRLSRYSDDAVCAAEGCQERPKASGYCVPHYARWKRHGDPLVQVYRGPYSADATCMVDDCERRPAAKGYCTKHRANVRRHGTPTAPVPLPRRPVNGTCSVIEDGEPCGLLARTRGMCSKHYGRLKRHGDPLAGRRSPVDSSLIRQGVQFEGWTVTGPVFRKGRTAYVPVACACGIASEVQAYGLLSGHSTRCRSCSAKQRMQHQARALKCPQCGAAFESPSPLSTVCPSCRPEYQRELNRAWMDDKGPEYAAISRHRARGKKYGLTPDEFDARLAEQDFKCAACGRAGDEGRRHLGLDHDHACCDHKLTPGLPACGKCARGFLCDGCNSGMGITDHIDLLVRKVAYLRYWAARRAELDGEQAAA